jgi:hypothetical protein
MLNNHHGSLYCRSVVLGRGIRISSTLRVVSHLKVDSYGRAKVYMVLILLKKRKLLMI